MDKKLNYRPDFATPPGDTLLETIEAIGMSQAQLAERTGLSAKTINEIVKAKSAITPQTALHFERVFGIPARFWLNRERNYRESLARIEEEKKLAGSCEWLKILPVKDMARLGWIDASPDKFEQIRLLLGFFGVSSFDQWDAVWRGKAVACRESPSFSSAPGAVYAWLRRGELLANRIECGIFEKDKFKRALDTIRKLTLKPPAVFVPETVKLCSEAGVAVVFVPEIKDVRLSGATYWLTGDKALIQLSLRYKTNDQLWFSFYHEAGHILLHGKREAFIEEGDFKVDRSKEQEADRFAADQLIPRARYLEFVEKLKLTNKFNVKNAIARFASEISVAQGIVVGRLQHDGLLDYKFCNGLKQKYTWSDGQSGAST